MPTRAEFGALEHPTFRRKAFAVAGTEPEWIGLMANGAWGAVMGRIPSPSSEVGWAMWDS